MIHKKFEIRLVLILLFLVEVHPVSAQIYDMRELATVDIESLDRAHTVIIIPEGILEEHGPYLPSYTDGYRNEYFTRQLADSIAKRDGWKVLIFPAIPLGTGGANHIAKKPIFPGTYHVHFSTLWAIFMDLASEFGKAGFRWVFIISEHGDPLHQRALDQASDFFNDIYEGTMVYLSGLIPDKPVSPGFSLSEKEQIENGLDVHSGLEETSTILFLRPDLVRSEYKNAKPLPGKNWKDLINVGANDEWPGYYGAPGLATTARGALIMEARSMELTGLALRIMDGFDFRKLKRLSELQMEDPAIQEYTKVAVEHAQRIQQTQQEWLRQKGF